jgi:hypothetical protein
MSLSDNNMENLLGRLAEARKAGAFNADAARYPWKAQNTPAKHQVQFKWLRVAVPVAAAAAVAFLLLGPTQFNHPVTTEVADNVRAHSPASKSIVAPINPTAPVGARVVGCDYNGDGVVDGLDIQAFLNHLKENAGDPQIEAEYLQHCLLGS